MISFQTYLKYFPRLLTGVSELTLTNTRSQSLQERKKEQHSITDTQLNDELQFHAPEFKISRFPFFPLLQIQKEHVAITLEQLWQKPALHEWDNNWLAPANLCAKAALLRVASRFSEIWIQKVP